MLRVIKMPIKEISVPTGEEVVDAQEPQERQPEEVFAEELPELVPEAKPVKKEESWTKAVPKRKAKAKAMKEEEKVDLKQRMPCPVCKRVCTLHSLLYTHKCTKDAREAKLKKSAELAVKPPEVIEKPVPLSEPEVIVEPVEQPVERRPMTYREALIERRLQMEARQRELHTTPIRNYFRRGY